MSTTEKGHPEPGRRVPVEERSIGGLHARPASVEDAPAMILLEDQAQAGRKGEPIPDSTSRTAGVQRVEKLLLSSSSWSLLVFDRECLVAYILGRPAVDADTQETIPYSEHLDSLMVRPDYWGRGIATGLLDWMIETRGQAGIKEITLWTETDNKRSRPLYERKGFGLTGAQRVHPERPEQQVQYRLTL